MDKIHCHRYTGQFCSLDGFLAGICPGCADAELLDRVDGGQWTAMD